MSKHVTVKCPICHHSFEVDLDTYRETEELFRGEETLYRFQCPKDDTWFQVPITYTEDDITPRIGEGKVETDQQAWLRDWFLTERRKNMETLEAGARQIITLISTFYGIIFGALALGSDKLEASMHYRPVLMPATFTIFIFLVAISAALMVVLPIFSYEYNAGIPVTQKETYDKIIGVKLTGLRLAIIMFGVGLFCFAWFIGAMLYFR